MRCFLSLPSLRETPERLEIRSPLPVGLRLLLGLAALVPLLAPYELLIRVTWPSLRSPFFVFAALVSAGALLVSGLFFLAALAGRSSRMVFDLVDDVFLYESRAPLGRIRQVRLPLAALGVVDVRVRDWSDSTTGYHLRLHGSGGRSFESGAFATAEAAAAARQRVEAVLGTWRSPGSCNVEPAPGGDSAAPPQDAVH